MRTETLKAECRHEISRLFVERGLVSGETDASVDDEIDRLFRRASLNERHKIAFLLRVSGATYRKIGDALGVSATRASSICQHACLSLCTRVYGIDGDAVLDMFYRRPALK